MLDFRPNPRGGRQRRPQQRRLLMLVLSLGLTIILIDKASDPAVWRWFDRLVSPQQADDDAGIDNRLDAVAKKGPPDAFLAPKDRPPRIAEGDRPIFADTKIGTGPQPPAADAEYLAGVRSEDLDAIRDDAPSSRDEQAVSLRLLDILRRSDRDALRKASLGPVTYAQLFRQPSQYRGRIVAISGIVRRVNPIELFPNEFGIKQYYQAWLWPTDNPSSPMVVYCLELPDGFPTGMELAEQAEVTGFFFKRWAYQAQDTLRTAPTLLARSLQWQKRPVMASERAHDWTIPLVFGGSILLALLTTWYVYHCTKRPRPSSADRPPDFEALENMEHGDDTTDER